MKLKLISYLCFFMGSLMIFVSGLLAVPAIGNIFGGLFIGCGSICLIVYHEYARDNKFSKISITSNSPL